MGFSPLANMSRRIPDMGRKSVRNANVTGVVIHYNAGVNSYGEATNPNREVSANYWIANDGTLIPNVDENYRAWTSGAVGYPNGALADSHSITFEVSNEPGWQSSNPMGKISDAAYNTLTKAIGDVFKRYNLGPVRRTTSPTAVGVRVHNDFVPTSCPGPWILGHMSGIISQAEAFRTNQTVNKDVRVKHYHNEDKTARTTKRTVKPGTQFYLHDQAGLATSKAKNIIGGVGPYSLTAHVYATGTPGDRIDLAYVWQNQKIKPLKNSPHYTETVVIGPDGTAKANVTFQRGAALGDAVYLRCQASSLNKGDVTVSLLDSDAYLYVAA